jgi:hypothetical protein
MMAPVNPEDRRTFARLGRHVRMIVHDYEVLHERMPTIRDVGLGGLSLMTHR